MAQQKQEIELKRGLEETKSKLKERIIIGKEIRSIPIHTEESLTEVKKNFKKWTDYNIDLLKNLFNFDKLSDEFKYMIYIPTRGLRCQQVLKGEIDDFIKVIDEKIACLESIYKRIESVGAPPNAL